jgi:hypothetical protein
VLKYAKKSRLREACATASFNFENSREGILDCFVFAIAAARDEIDTLRRLIGT